MRRRALLTAAPGLAAAAAHAARAALPAEGPLRIVVGFPPGGGNDTLARILAERLRPLLGRPVVVDNRPGGNGIPAAEAVRRASPDGLTLLAGPSSAMAVNPVVLRSLPYDPVADFAPVVEVGRFPLVLVVAPDRPWRSLPELLAAARAAPGRLDYSSGASSFRLATEMLAQAAGGLALNHVPYRGSAAAALAAATGEVALTLGDVSAVVPLLGAGRLRALAVSTPERTAGMPDLPTVAEAGVPGYAVVFWSGLFAPAATPAGALAVLEEAARGVLAEPAVRERFAALGVEPSGAPGAGMRAMIRGEIARFRAAAEAAGIEPEG